MKPPALLQRLADGVEAARRAGQFCVSGPLPPGDPGIEVKGVGRLKLPLNPTDAKRLIAACRPAAYGKGTRTYLDRAVRDSLELDPRQFKLTDAGWDGLIRTTVQAVAEGLGMPANRLEAQLYKLLVYRAGGFFLPHRDSEKTDRMVGSLVVVLPTPFKGGKLVVRHGDQSKRLEFQAAAAGEGNCFAAFFADCKHEVTRVESGLRLCLAYNLSLTVSPRAKKAVGAPRAKKAVGRAGPVPASDALARSISGWVTGTKATPLVFALDHHYTQRGLAVDLLKGPDRSTAELVVAAAEQAGCRAYLCQVSRHISQFADDGSGYERYRGRPTSSSTSRNLELGEIYEDDLFGETWADPAGKRQKFPGLHLEPTAIVASTPFEQWKPTKEDYEGYTGNAGNTLDRWYHRSALCVWHAEDHFDVLAQGGSEFAIDLLDSLTAKLKKTPLKRRESAREDCLRLARGIARRSLREQRWEERESPEETAKNRAFLELVIELDDPATALEVLKSAAQRDVTLPLSPLIVAMCRRHGCAVFADALTALLKAHSDQLLRRDAAWLEKLATAKFTDADRGALLAKLAPLAVDQFCQPGRRHYHTSAEFDASRKTLLSLLRVVLLAESDHPGLSKLLDYVTSQPERFPPASVQVPCLTEVVPWCRARKLTIPPRLAEWLGELNQTLQEATAVVPQPPTDWRRPAEIGCRCEVCAKLITFLADPQAETGRIAAREDLRRHLLDSVSRWNCDVTHTLDRSGSKHALIFKKTHASYERTLKQFTQDQELLETVSGLQR